ncbi:MAG: pyridoxamine 5'-phosphate oxidase family protein [Pseudomonadota bacterium]
MVLAIGAHDRLQQCLCGGERGFATLSDPSTLRIPLQAMDDPLLATDGQTFGSLWFVPGLNETLRINGRIAGTEHDALLLKVEECYLHCAKALMRSEFWGAEPTETATDAAAFLQHARFLSFATMNAAGQVDVSPKGDPAGALLAARTDAILFPDRPGNRRIDSFLNVLEQPRVSLLVLVPGSPAYLRIHGPASLYAEEALLRAFAVHDKLPKLVTQVRCDPAKLVLQTSATLDQAERWSTEDTTHGLIPTEIFKAHIRHSREQGIGASMTRAAVRVPGLLRRTLDSDYRKNLY